MRRATLSVSSTLLLFAFARLAHADDEVVLRTQADAIYCQETDVQHVWTEFTCFRPRDGRFAQFTATDLTSREIPHVTTGIKSEFIGFANATVWLLRAGASWISSDAALVTCRAQRDGLRCRHWLGPHFFLPFR